MTVVELVKGVLDVVEREENKPVIRITLSRALFVRFATEMGLTVFGTRFVPLSPIDLGCGCRIDIHPHSDAPPITVHTQERVWEP